MTIQHLIAQRLNLRNKQVEATLKLLDEGATIPFISRYRKEATGALDEVQVAAVADEYRKVQELEHRKAFVLETIEAQGKLTDELRQRITQSWDATEVEDLYLPFKPKRRTKAQVARERGLEPLAQKLLLRPQDDPELAAERFLTDEVPDVAAALQGARDIIAEQISEDERSRQSLRNVFGREAVISSKLVKGKEEEAAKYRDYFDWSEPLRRCTSHRLLAMRRGESEGMLRVSIAPADESGTADRIARPFVRPNTAAAAQIATAAADAYKRLLRPSIETEFAAQSKQQADEEAIRVFAQNLQQLLLAAPLGARRIMGIDPGFRTGCKVVCLDEQGDLLHNTTIYPHEPKKDRAAAAATLQKLAKQYRVEAVAIGNGTAGRETEELVRSLKSQANAEVNWDEIPIFLVSEDGASVYSASAVARVGQYQHDVDATAVKRALDYTVEHCVNAVGVNLNTASAHLLTYVSGLGAALAQNIVNYRAEHGAFASRKELLKVPRLGAKAFEQCAGFLRIPQAKHPLDNTAVHPERYALVEKMASDAGTDLQSLIAHPEIRQKIDLKRYCTAEVGLPTLHDIWAELDKPGRDPRGTAQVFQFEERVHSIDDLEIGMVLPGVVTNVTNFGAFVDLGIKTKGLVHVSQLADRFVKDPAEVVQVQQQVEVRVVEVDKARGRIALSMKKG